MRISRRGFLAGTLGTAALATGLAGCSTSRGQTAVLLSSTITLPERFRAPFVIPPVKKPAHSADGVAHYEIVQRSARQEILPGVKTEIMGYDGLFPGPTFESRRGQQIVVTHRNELEVPTVVHLHGGHTPAESDGYPIDFALPQTGGDHFLHHSDMVGKVSHGSRDYRYPLDQRAATLWYHDHRMDFTAPQVWRGLAGFHLIRDDEEDQLGLPSGDHELPMMIMDRAFDESGELSYPSLDPMLMDPPGVTDHYMSGVLGDVILVNGVPWPTMEVDATRYRLRILNASNARRYQLRLDPPPPEGPAFIQVGSDGGLLATPQDQDSIVMAPAERFDVIVDFSGYPIGTQITLTNGLGSGPTDAVMRFVVARRAGDESRVPERLSEVEVLTPPADAPRRTWRFSRGEMSDGGQGWLINGKPFDPGRMDAMPQLGEIEIWRFSTDLHHPIHVHLSPFQVLRREGGDRGPFDSGWKDTVDLTPAEYVDVAIRFDDYAGHYLLHCHNLEHEDMAMMSAFQTLR